MQKYQYRFIYCIFIQFKIEKTKLNFNLQRTSVHPGNINHPSSILPSCMMSFVRYVSHEAFVTKTVCGLFWQNPDNLFSSVTSPSHSNVVKSCGDDVIIAYQWEPQTEQLTDVFSPKARSSGIFLYSNVTLFKRMNLLCNTNQQLLQLFFFFPFQFSLLCSRVSSSNDR